MSEPTRQQDALADLVDRLAGACPDPGVAARVTGLAADLRQEPPAGVPTSDQPLARLCRGFGLTAFERDLLLLAGLPEEHEVVAGVMRLHHPRGEARACPALAAEVLGLDHRARHHLRGALEVGPLRRHGLVLLDPESTFPEASMRLVRGLWSVLRGHDHWPSGLPRVLVPPAAALPGSGPQVARALAGTRRLVVVHGDRSRSPEELLALLLGALSRNVDGGTPELVAVPAAGLGVEAEQQLSAHAVARAAVPVLLGRPERIPLPDHPGPVVVCLRDPAGTPLDDRPVVDLDLGQRGLGESQAMWSGLVPELNGGAGRLAGLLRLDRVQAGRAVNDARDAVSGIATEVTLDAVVEHARRRTGTLLPPSGRLLRPNASWDALVTTADNEALLRSLVGRVLGASQVLHEWGFGSRSAPGVRALLAGPPGTGKTLSAHVVAAALGLDLIAVDLSALVSKWLGETEKNISAIFDAAEGSQAVLFFDEADAVFGRRTDAGDAQSRWANLETAHLLNRMDDFGGLVLLATNLRGHIDEAFVRRLDAIVELEEPGPEERRRLWSAHLPTAAPLDPDVDLDALAAGYEITGGLIRNATLAAAYAAAARGRPIDHHTLLDAVEREYQKAGRSFPGRTRRPTPSPTPSGGT